MNTHDKYELPPLPRGDIAADTCPTMWVHTDQQLQDYARAAIEADRKRRGEPVAWHSKQYGVVWMAIKPGNLVAGTQWFIQGRQAPVAEVVSPGSLVWHIPTSELDHGTVFYSAPQPDEPAQSTPSFCEDEGCPHYGTPHFSITRTAEPVKAPNIEGDST